MPSYSKSFRQKQEYKLLVDNLQNYENSFIRKCMLQLSLNNKTKISLTNELIGELNKINKCRKLLQYSVIINVDEFLPNRPVPSCILKALRDENIPPQLRRKLTHPNRVRDLNNSFWQLEKTTLKEWISSNRYLKTN